jgi:predicted DNA-binding protein with PD1-like motif
VYYEKRIASKERGDDRAVVCVVTIELSPTETYQIKLHEGDDPNQVAKAFCKRHVLPASTLKELGATLTEQLNTANRHKTERSLSIQEIADWDLELIEHS